MVILTSIAKVLIGLFIIALVLAFITAIFLLGAIVATLGTATQPLFGRAVRAGMACLGYQNPTSGEQDLSKANWYKDKFLSLGGDDELLNIVPDNAKAAAYRRMGGNACVEKEAMSYEC